MELSNYQKKIISLILERRVYNINSFFESQIPELVKYSEFEVPTFRIIHENEPIIINHGSSIFTYEFVDSDKVKNSFLEFIALWDLLDEDYIITVKLDKQEKRFLPIITKEIAEALSVKYERVIGMALQVPEYTNFIEALPDYTNKSDYSDKFRKDFRFFLNIVMNVRPTEIYNELNTSYYNDFQNGYYFKDIINQLSIENYTYEFYPTPELSAFVKRGYKSYEEFHVEEESRDRKRAILYPMIIAIVTVSISIFANYLIYTNKREVSITNQTDTMKVLVLPQNTYRHSDAKDSLLIDTLNNWEH